MPSRACLALAAVCAVVVAGCGSSSGGGAATPSSGGDAATPASGGPPATPGQGRLHIVAVIAPTCPVERLGDPPCVAPYQGTVVVVDSSRAASRQVTTNAAGEADVPLPAGTYSVEASPSGAGRPRLVQPVTVTISAGATATADLHFDSGIR